MIGTFNIRNINIHCILLIACIISSSVNISIEIIPLDILMRKKILNGIPNLLNFFKKLSILLSGLVQSALI